METFSECSLKRYPNTSVSVSWFFSMASIYNQRLKDLSICMRQLLAWYNFCAWCNHQHQCVCIGFAISSSGLNLFPLLLISRPFSIWWHCHRKKRKENSVKKHIQGGEVFYLNHNLIISTCVDSEWEQDNWWTWRTSPKVCTCWWQLCTSHLHSWLV